MQDVILLPLKQGKNQLIVKFYNGFEKSSTIGIATDVKQVIYHKTLKPFSVEKGRYYPVSWKLHDPLSPHTTLGLPNVRLELK
jgi:alpha-L-fucosidase